MTGGTISEVMPRGVRRRQATARSSRLVWAMLARMESWVGTSR
jgi:hypothetical protein